PLLDLGGEEALELGLRCLEERDADALQLLARLRLGERRADVGADLRGELSGKRRRREEALPQRRLVVGQALLGDRRQVRRAGKACLARHTERTRAAAL